MTPVTCAQPLTENDKLSIGDGARPLAPRRPGAGARSTPMPQTGGGVEKEVSRNFFAQADNAEELDPSILVSARPAELVD